MLLVQVATSSDGVVGRTPGVRDRLPGPFVSIQLCAHIREGLHLRSCSLEDGPPRVVVGAEKLAVDLLRLAHADTVADVLVPRPVLRGPIALILETAGHVHGMRNAWDLLEHEERPVLER